MINPAEREDTMINVTRIVEDESVAENVAYEWENLRSSIRRVLSQLDDSREDTRKLTGIHETPDFDNLESLLMSVHDYISGHIEELTPGRHKWEQEVRFHALPEERRVLESALKAGINAVALERLCISQRMEAVRYISAHGLASLNYEASCRAVCEYEEARRSEILSTYRQNKRD